MPNDNIPPDLIGPDEPPFTTEELSRALVPTVADDESGNEATDRIERWEIEHPGEAAWAMAHVAAATAEIEMHQANYDEWRARLDAWLDHTTRRARQTREFFTGHLGRWALANRTDKVKSFELPAGKVTTKAGSVTLEVEDQDLLFEWLDNHPTLVPDGNDDPAPWTRKANLTNLKKFGTIVLDVPTRVKLIDAAGEITEWDMALECINDDGDLVVAAPPATDGVTEVLERCNMLVHVDDAGRYTAVPGVLVVVGDPTPTVTVTR